MSETPLTDSLWAYLKTQLSDVIRYSSDSSPEEQLITYTSKFFGVPERLVQAYCCGTDLYLLWSYAGYTSAQHMRNLENALTLLLMKQGTL